MGRSKNAKPFDLTCLSHLSNCLIAVRSQDTDSVWIISGLHDFTETNFVSRNRLGSALFGKILRSISWNCISFFALILLSLSFCTVILLFDFVCWSKTTKETRKADYCNCFFDSRDTKQQLLCFLAQTQNQSGKRWCSNTHGFFGWVSLRRQLFKENTMITIIIAAVVSRDYCELKYWNWIAQLVAMFLKLYFENLNERLLVWTKQSMMSVSMNETRPFLILL